MIDKELEAIYKCHEYLQDLDNETRMRVFKYLLDRYKLVNTGTNFSNSSTTLPEKQIEEVETVVQEIVKETTQKIPSKSKHPNSNGKKTKSSLQSYSLITSLNLVPKGKISLKDYYVQYITKSNFENNIVLLTYLTNELEEKNIGVNHIYTCLKHLGLKVPNIKQSLFDTKNRKGWIDTANVDDLKITVSGENFMDHEIERK